ncbi:MAG TPA: hypothetical protein VE093_29865 [Polyangiaceae bacterium]|jgi:hypothetical protein|nr:hypothetical protein [Polyangiaceae bacterium]
MAKDPPQTYTGPLTIDLTPLEGRLVNLPPGGTQRLRRERDGIEGVIAELNAVVPKHGGAVGITTEIYHQFTECNEDLAKIRAARGVVQKLAEVLRESEAHKEHVREGLLSILAKAVKSAAQHMDASLVAHFEKTLKYNAQLAYKAARTRRRNAKVDEPRESDEGDIPGTHSK